MHLRIFLVAISCLILLSSAKANFDLDVDDDGKTEALTDGLSVIRHLFGFSGEALGTTFLKTLYL